MRSVGILPLALLVGVAACGVTEPIEPGPDTGPVTAFIDGDAFIAETATITRFQGMTIIDAADSEHAFRFEFTDRGVWNHAFGPGNGVTAELTTSAGTWFANDSIGSGTITVSDQLPSLHAGSFRLTLINGGARVEVTQGRFRIIG